jgi:RNA polymerase sigma-70 factor (ECF subfamily)
MEPELATLAAIARGDARVFGQWVASAELPVRRALRAFAAHVDTEAVVQEAFLRVWQVAPRFTHDGRPHALLRFTLRTARNVALSEVRRRARPEQVEALERELSAEEAIAPAAPDPLLRAQLARCRELLPPQPRAALDQRLASAGSDDDSTLAQRARMSLNTFLQNFTRARRFLKACLEKAGVHLDAELAP